MPEFFVAPKYPQNGDLTKDLLSFASLFYKSVSKVLFYHVNILQNPCNQNLLKWTFGMISNIASILIHDASIQTPLILHCVLKQVFWEMTFYKVHPSGLKPYFLHHSMILTVQHSTNNFNFCEKSGDQNEQIEWTQPT